MKLSSETVDILKNFAGINTNIWIEAGKTIQTLTAQRNVVGIAEVKEEFPNDFGIWDLPKFLATLGFFDSPELTFEEKNNRVIISDGKKQFSYYGSQKSTLTVLEKKVEFPDETIVKIELKKEALNELMKVSSGLGLPHIAIKSDGKTVSLVVFDKDKNTENEYTTQLGKSDGSVYTLIFDTENIKVIPDDYNLSIAKMGKGFVGKFENKNKALVYYTGLTRGSEYIED